MPQFPSQDHLNDSRNGEGSAEGQNGLSRREEKKERECLDSVSANTHQQGEPGGREPHVLRKQRRARAPSLGPEPWRHASRRRERSLSLQLGQTPHLCSNEEARLVPITMLTRGRTAGAGESPAPSHVQRGRANRLATPQRVKCGIGTWPHNCTPRRVPETHEIRAHTKLVCERPQ